ncbi:type IVB secretion system protein IcmH/DotU [Duffyella gerundensis]|uniref:type IVB secretion system protein IcmH/DotU n=1 Tax=Duffyella gerundensis TaxID=1619313 RepID=UPI001654A9F9|nr:type IVB secretion system protein IcmH/DotU [Duffyella gerundensis]
MTLEPTALSTRAASADNFILNAAAPLMNAIVQIRLAATHDDPAGLRQQLISELRQFENRCKQAGVPFETIVGARYCLCSALDEAAAQTPWGTRGVWSGSGMLVTFHNESWGGEKFFQLLSRISQSPEQHIWLLELIHYCLLLGYEGRYRGAERGRAQCDAIRQRLAQLIQATREKAQSTLHSKVEVQRLAANSWRPPVPLWACATVAALIACLIYSGLNWRLGRAAEPLLRSIYQTPLPQASAMRRSASSQALLNLRQRLNDVVAAGQLEVSDGAFGSKVILPADKIFDAGGTSLNAVGRALVMRVSAAMEEVKGTILVSVYTDDSAPQNSRFPSNFEFSHARARTIAQLLSQQLDHGQQIKAEGRGDSNAMLPNDSRENRARNRRVEITLFATPEPASAPAQGTQ